MRCTQAEKLIPLYAGDDLPGEQTARLRTHLESCARCRQLAAEFEASRNWLSNFAAPEFDEATLDGMRDAVLEEIGRIKKRPGWLEWISPNWNPRFAFAASMAILLFAAFVTYAYRDRQPKALSGKEKTPDVVQENDRKDSIDNNGRRDDEEIEKRPSVAVNQRRSQKRVRHITTPAPDKSVQPQGQRFDVAAGAQEPAGFEPLIALPDNGNAAQTNLAFNREMTRIEFQTADPNIRIIWLTPKESSSSTKPITNIR